MDIRCPSCSTLYEFDENLIPDEGIHLRCSACGQAFRVRRAVDASGATGWYVRRAMTGEMVAVPDLGDVQRAVIERRFAPGDLLSRSGAHWKRLDEVAELEPFFKVAEEMRPRRSTLGGALGPAPKTVPDDPSATRSMHARAFSVSPLDPAAAVTGQTLSGATGSGPTRLQSAAPATRGGHAMGGATQDHPVAAPVTEESGPIQVTTGSTPSVPGRRSARTPMMGLAGRTDGAILKEDVRRVTGPAATTPRAEPPPAPPSAPAPDPVAASKGSAEVRGDGWSLGESESARETAWSIGGVAGGASTPGPEHNDLAVSGDWEAAAGLKKGPGMGRIVAPIALVALGAVLAVFVLRPDLVGLGAESDGAADTPESMDTVADDMATDPATDDSASPATGDDDGSAESALAAADGSGDASEGSGATAAVEPDTDNATGDTNGAVAAATPAPDPSPAPRPAATAPSARPQPSAAPNPEPAREASGYDGLMARGNELLASNPSGALEAFSAAADQSDRAEAHVGVARAYEAMGRFDLAAARYGRATRQNERYQPAWAGLAAARQRTGDTDGAIEAWERVIRIRSTGAAADRAREALGELRGGR